MIKSKNFLQKQQSVRVAINTPIQGTAADIIKMAMINIHNKIKNDNLPAKMIIQIHDELLFEVEDKFVDKFIPIVKSEMESVINLKVPLIVDIGIGENWETAH